MGRGPIGATPARPLGLVPLAKAFLRRDQRIPL